MKLTLIKPNIGRLADGPYIDTGRMEPLELGVLAALTPPDIEVVLYDDRMEVIPYDEPTDLVAITVEIHTARRAYEISAAFRRRGVPVILGGFQPTLVPEECARYADAIYMGDAESLWPRVVADARRRKLQPVYRAQAGMPQPGVLTRRDLFKGKGYLPITLMQFSRGCRYACDFCAISVYFNRTQYTRNIQEVIREIEQQERRLIFFVDDNICADREALKGLCRALIPLRIHWVSQASLDMTEDLELMELMVKSGCLGHVVGFESLDPRNLKKMKKAPNLRSFDHYRQPLAIIRDYGLQLWAAFILGYDHDSSESIAATVDFALDNKFCFAAFNTLLPYPQTPLYKKLQAENRLLYDGHWWLHPDYRFNHAAFVPKLMMPAELTEASFQARARFNSITSIVRRAFDFKTNMSSLYRLGIYLQFNPLFRREVFKKQGMRLGLETGELSGDLL